MRGVYYLMGGLTLLGPVRSFDFSRTYDLIQDEVNGRYYMELYMGTKLQRVDLLVDTQANGTAIDYTY